MLGLNITQYMLEIIVLSPHFCCSYRTIAKQKDVLYLKALQQIFTMVDEHLF